MDEIMGQKSISEISSCNISGGESTESGNLMEQFASQTDEKSTDGETSVEVDSKIRMRNVCGECSKVCRSATDLKSHQLIHTAKPYKCEECDHRFAKWCYLRKHLRDIHTNEKPHVCEVCGKAFAVKRRLTTHLLSHLEEKPFKCEQCGNRFVQMGNLKRHLRIHNNERPFACEFCDRTFTFGSGLKVHLNSHLREKPYVCRLCSEGFSERNDLKIHLQNLVCVKRAEMKGII